MGWIECIQCEKFRHNFVARTFHLFGPFCTEFHNATKRSSMHPNRTKHTETLVLSPLGWIRCVRCEMIRCNFVAWTFALVRNVLPRVSYGNLTVPNARKRYEMHQIMSLGCNGVDRVCLLRKIRMRLRGTNFCTSLAPFAPSFVRQPNGPKCT